MISSLFFFCLFKDFHINDFLRQTKPTQSGLAKGYKKTGLQKKQRTGAKTNKTEKKIQISPERKEKLRKNSSAATIEP